MSRKPRLFTKSQTYHVIMRGNNQQNLFYDPKDKIFFLQRLNKYSKEVNITLYGYCLMNNHIHLLVGNANKNLSLFIQKIANSYVYYFNHKYERTGHLFQGRFKSEPINDDTYFKTVLRYIIQNPEKAQICSFSTYKWSSFDELKTSSDSNITDTSYIHKLFGGKTATVNFISQNQNDKCMEYENKYVISDLRAIQLIKLLFDLDSPESLLRQKINTQKSQLKLLKSKGLSISQISRLTSIPKRIIKNA